MLKSDLAKFVKEQEQQKRIETLNRVKLATPVKTGFAKNSWKIQNRMISSDCSYVDDLNRGSSRQAPSNFIETAILQDSSLIPNGTIVLNV